MTDHSSALQLSDPLRSYWLDRLSGLPEMTTWPHDRPWPDRPAYRRGLIEFHVPAAVTALLHELGRRHHVTPLSVAATALQVLLARVADPSQVGDVAIGTPVALRCDHPHHHETHLANTVVLRRSIGPDRSFEELLRDGRQCINEDMKHAEYPFVWLARHAARDSSFTGSPVVQVLLVMEDEPPDAPAPDGLSCKPCTFQAGTANFDLRVALRTVPEGYYGTVEYASDVYDEGTVRVFAGCLGRMLRQVAEHPSTAVGDLVIVEAAAACDTADSSPGVDDRPLAHELFDRQAARSPGIPAVRWDGGQLTYRQLDAVSGKLAAKIHSAMAPGCNLVAVHARRSPALAVGLMAVLRAGCAYVPLDPTYPRERIEYMLADSGASILLCDADIADTVMLPAGVRRIPLPDVRDDDLASGDGPIPGVSRESLAYVIYTSGSTGQPKGVELPHDALANLLDWQLQNSKAGVGWNTLQFAPFSFDVAFQELFSTWATGGTLVLIGDDQRRDPVQLIDYLDRHQVNRLFLPFVALQALAESASTLARYPQSLREVVTAGEQLVITRAIRDFFRITGASLENQYGPSETHVVTAERLPRDSGSWPQLPPIGKAIAGVMVRILDERGQELPSGVPGEICVAGRALARGYRGRPELTAQRFPKAADGTRWYRTGDFGRRAPDGRLHYLGRRDGQVKVRGYRIELGEVEACLKSQPGVADAVVVVRDDDRGKGLVAFCVPSGGAALSPRALRGALAAALPEYMVPAAIKALAEFPLTPSGKVDRLRLSKTPVEAAEGLADHTARDDVESGLVTLWQDLLGYVSIDIYDDFFDLGGDSFLGIRLAAAIKKTFNADITLADILTARSISRLAETIRSGIYVPPGGTLALLQAGERSAPLYAFHPLSGTVVRYAALTSALGADQTVWGIQASGLQPGEAPLESIAEMADHYVRAMRAVHPGGPWHLIGYSMGGVFAVEAARRLRAENEEIGLVGLLDTTAFSDPEEDAEYAVRILAGVMLKLDADIDDLLRLSAAEQSKRLYELAVTAGTLPPDYDTDRIRRMLNMYNVMSTALARHQIAPYDSRVTLFRALDRSLDSGPVDALLGWGSLAAEVKVHHVPGDHHTMMDPQNVEYLSQVIRGYVRPEPG